MSSRQLAAIMFTDIVGYTALMGKDTDKALELVRISKEIQKPLVEKYNGRWLKEMGDGALSSFTSALDAVNCSIEIQEIARGKLDAKLRIGIHLGDVTVEDDDVHGDGVNVASRLESIADPGGVYISESIEKAIRGQTDVQAKYLGEIHLKNVDYGVRTYALQGVGLPVPEVMEEKKLSGHLWAEMQRRGVIRAGATYVVLLLLLILLAPYADSMVGLPQWSTTALLTMLIVGLPVALYLAWNYERSPEGFIRTTSQQSWQNPYSASQRKPLTGNIIIAGLSLVIIIMFLYPRYIDRGVEGSDAGGIPDKSIAVMAFVDMSANKDQEYFADGISEEIINNLAQIKELRVIGRSSSFQFKGQNPDLREVGDKLGVSTVLEGSVRKSGNQLRITVTLINVEDGSHIWSKSYDRELDDIFKIQDEISLAITEQMKISLGLTKSNPVDFKVYDLYLQARTLLNQRGQALSKSISLFEEVIEKDSMYRPAWTGLAQAWMVMAHYNPDIPKNETLLKAEKAIYKAMALDPEDAETLAALATIHRIRMKWSTALEFYKQAHQLNRRSTTILEDYSQFLMEVGYIEVGLELAENMIRIDPLTPLYLHRYGLLLVLNGRINEGKVALTKAVEIDENFLFATGTLMRLYLQQGELDNALNLVTHSPIYSKVQRENYIVQIEALVQKDSDFNFNAIPLPHRLYVVMGLLEQTVELLTSLEQESEIPSPGAFGLQTEKVRNTARFKQLLADSGLVSFWRENGWPDRCRAVGEDDFVCE